ncbi:hypothetical protein QBC36DRAFT_323185 [Triangularia setosa]|uniref:Uncharacterized protein n=1 Tax=Triangularia setosa TaxID=2587417 RepID=A0AAN7AB60_9PEZI|nr:hypothetical protein QBC36DRAFT_323185 [Podospora setosa]
MAFGKSIHALLDTYSNCISLLKAFRHRGDEPSPASPPENVLCTQDKQADLRESLKTDRALVEKAYASRVRESGNRFRKGDARAISSVDGVLKKLKEAIKSLLRISSQKQNLDLDYESLMCLSNASRLETIKTIDGLSRRLGSPSRSSLASHSSKASSKASKTSSKSSSSSKSSKTSSGSLSTSPSSTRHKLPPKTSETSKPKRDSVQQEKSAPGKKAAPRAKKDIKDGKSGKPSSRSMKLAPRKDPQPLASSSKSRSATPESAPTSPKPTSVSSSKPVPESPKPAPVLPKSSPTPPKPAKASPKHQKRASLKHSEKASLKQASASSKPAAASPKPHTLPSPPVSPNPNETITQNTHFAMAPIPRLAPSPAHNPHTSPNRISIMSFSSDSTKLGEIPQRRWQPNHRSLYITTTGSPSEEEEDEYNIRPVFPLKPYTVEVKERGRFWGLFARRGSQS